MPPGQRGLELLQVDSTIGSVKEIMKKPGKNWMVQLISTPSNYIVTLDKYTRLRMQIESIESQIYIPLKLSVSVA